MPRRTILFFLCCWTFSHTVASAAASTAKTTKEAPTCKNPEECADSASCDLYWLDYWVFAGRDFSRHEVLPWSRDPQIQFRQQSRKGFPRWNRYHHFRQIPNKPYEFLVAPGLAEWPLECHDRLYNVRSNETNHLYTDRPILQTEVMLADCIIDERTSGNYDLDYRPSYDFDYLQTHGICMDTVVYHDDMGVSAKRGTPQSTIMAMGMAVHMHRAEFWNATTQTNEALIGFVYGHENSDVLLLPFAPIFASVETTDDINTANVELAFDMDGELADYFTKPGKYLFAEFEQAKLWVKLIATRDLQPSERLYIYAPPTTGGERPVPEDFFPSEWIAQETRTELDPITHEFRFDTLDLTKQPPGGVEPATVTATKEPLGTYLHRVGLPDELVPTMTEWGENLGVLDHLRRYISDKTLEIGMDERTSFRNGTWWTRRFDSSWQSNMHYVAVDDDESNEQFFHTLAKGGFDTVLKGVGEYFNLTQLSCFYPTFIVVSHCVQSMMHSDSDFPGVFNMIFPISQVLDGEAELVLGVDEDTGDLHIPYVYERDHGILVGLGGMHGTSPTDYRNGKGSHRIVMSVYMGDFSNETMRHEFIDQYEDPPYANYWPGQLDHALSERVHWKRDDPTKSLGVPLPRKFPKTRPVKKRKRRMPPPEEEMYGGYEEEEIVYEDEEYYEPYTSPY